MHDYHDVASAFLKTNKLLWKQNALERSDSGSDFVNAEVRKSIALAGRSERALVLGR